MNVLNKLLVMIAISFTLMACGGGGGLERDNGSTPSTPITPPSDTFTIVLSISNAAGDASNALSQQTPLTITAQVSDTQGNALADALVTFNFDRDGIASFNNDTGTALTNSSGQAQIGLVVGQLSGDGQVSASISQGANATIGFRSAGVQQQAEVPASLLLFASSTQMASSGSDDIELIAVLKNQQNVLLEGIEVDFAADQGASLEIVNASTNADGTARAILRTTNNPENRVIRVSASSDALSGELDIKVVGTEVTISGSSSVIINDSAPYTIIVADSNGKGIANQVVNLSSDIGELDNLSPRTGPTGQVTVNFVSTSAGSGTIEASALNSSASVNVVVQQDDFGFINLPSSDIQLQSVQTLELRWFKNSSAFSGGSVTLSSSRGLIAVPTVSTDTNGVARFSISSDFAGPASISAIGSDGQGNEVSARATVAFVATQVDSIFVDATPDLIGPEGQESTITAILRDPAGNLVKGKTVNFSLIDSTGGTIEPNSATTDSNGIASTTYVSNAVSGQDGVTVSAESDGVTSSTDLTVGDRAFDISIGTGGVIESPDSASYLKEFAVFVSDSVGRPVVDANLTASATPVKVSSAGAYRKGFWQWDPTDNVWVAITTVTCNNEDINNNGRLDQGEDTNGDGELSPGIIGTIGFQNGLSATNESGQATLELRYPKQFGPWVDLDIAVFGQSSGSEAKDSQAFTLSVASDDLNTRSAAPPRNPFGASALCTDTQ